MENREKLENPTIDFSFVTLLDGSASDCQTVDDGNEGDPLVKFCVNEGLGEF